MKNILFLYLCLLLGLPTKTSSQDLSPANSGVLTRLDTGWTFLYKGNWYPAKVPGNIFTDLLDNGLIEDPFYENNEKKLQWIEQEQWVYRKLLTLSKKTIEHRHIELVFEGLDTYAEVFVNHHLVMKCNNMFRSWEKDIKPWLSPGMDTLEVRFYSPIEQNRKKVEQYPYLLPAGNETVPIKVSPFTRKAAYQFGWDWGPRLVGCGIWRSAYLRTWSDFHLEDVYTQVRFLDDSLAILEVEATVRIDGKEKKRYRFSLNNLHKDLQLAGGRHRIHMEYRIPHPRLWWPNGSGKPFLYEIVAQFSNQHNSYQQITHNIGLRTVQLIQEKDSIGTSFYFKVNGRPVFMKGANYIPQDIFPSRVREEQYRRLLTQVKSAGMNMIRVWGGGIYERNIFYDLCDEMGILVWQDFMFAGSLYPVEDTFVNNVREEVQYNIRRLRNHPCLALWCGNNEIEVAWKHWGWQKQYGYSSADSVALWRSYQRLFQKVIPQIVQTLDNHRAYVPTSPLSNWGKQENFNHHSMHYWGVWHGKEPIENYSQYVGRFMVEYGYQSFPSMSVIRRFAGDSSLYLNSRVMRNRQKSYIGNDLIRLQSTRWLGKPHNFSDFVKKSLDFQAIALKRAIMSHRTHYPHCMGTLFWQLNDCWPGPSWSVIDYFGHPKPALNIVRKYFKSIVATVEEKGDSLRIYLVSDAYTPHWIEGSVVFKGKQGQILSALAFHTRLHRPDAILLHIQKIPQLISHSNRKDLRIEIVLNEQNKCIFKDTYRLNPLKSLQQTK